MKSFDRSPRPAVPVPSPREAEFREVPRGGTSSRLAAVIRSILGMALLWLVPILILRAAIESQTQAKYPAAEGSTVEASELLQVATLR